MRRNGRVGNLILDRDISRSGGEEHDVGFLGDDLFHTDRHEVDIVLNIGHDHVHPQRVHEAEICPGMRIGDIDLCGIASSREQADDIGFLTRKLPEGFLRRFKRFACLNNIRCVKVGTERRGEIGKPLQVGQGIVGNRQRDDRDELLGGLERLFIAERPVGAGMPGDINEQLDIVFDQRLVIGCTGFLAGIDDWQGAIDVALGNVRSGG